MVDLGTLGGTNSAAFGINDRGQIVGQSQTGAGADRAFLWTVKEGMVDLGTLGGGSSVAFGINNRGQIVGESQTGLGEYHAIFWAP